MRAVFTCILLSVVLMASSERKIIVGSFATEQGVRHALEMFQSKLGSDFLLAHQRLGFQVVARPSGRQYIIALEPFASYKEAKKVKKLLPKGYETAFINKYTPPTSLVEVALLPNPEVIESVKAPTQHDDNASAMPKEARMTPAVTTLLESNVTLPEHNTSVNPHQEKEDIQVPSASKEPSYIIDAVTMKLIDAKKAYYAVEGQTYGIMSPSGKFAFADKKSAEEFVKHYGGRVVDYATSKQLEQQESK